jgi:ATP-dependent RNA helicase DDX6/DHH1
MDPRARYPPGTGNGRGGNPNYYGRGPPFSQQNHYQQQPTSSAHQQQYVQRQPQQQHQNHHQQQQQQHHHHHHQQQQWMRRNQIAQSPADASGTSGPKAVAPSPTAVGNDSSSQDWKAQLKLPPADTRFRTEVIHAISTPFFVCFWNFWNVGTIGTRSP